MTYAPQTLLDARAYLRTRTGLDANALGIVGDVQHDTSGYHVGWDRLVLGKGTQDYSYRESVRDHVQTDAASALDIGAGWPRWRELTLWLVAQCKAGTADTRDIREVIYTPDGTTVRRWDRLGIRSTGDSSHLTHTHISYHRDSADRDKVGLFRRFFELEDDMADIAQDDWTALIWRTEAIASGRDTVAGGPTKGQPVPLVGEVRALTAAVAAVRSEMPPPVDEDSLVGRVVEQLATRLPSAEDIALALMRQLLPTTPAGS